MSDRLTTDPLTRLRERVDSAKERAQHCGLAVAHVSVEADELLALVTTASERDALLLSLERERDRYHQMARSVDHRLMEAAAINKHLSDILVGRIALEPPPPILLEGYDKGRTDERRDVVKWLRGYDPARQSAPLSDRIELGEHIEAKP